jgi:hypothetical protein
MTVLHYDSAVDQQVAHTVAAHGVNQLGVWVVNGLVFQFVQIEDGDIGQFSFFQASQFSASSNGLGGVAGYQGKGRFGWQQSGSLFIAL